LFDYLYERSDRLRACWSRAYSGRRRDGGSNYGEQSGVSRFASRHGSRVSGTLLLGDEYNIDAVRLMLDVGFPIAHPETSHGYSPCTMRLGRGRRISWIYYLRRGHPVDLVDPTYHATALWLRDLRLHDRKAASEGEFKRVVQSLIDARARGIQGSTKVLQAE